MKWFVGMIMFTKENVLYRLSIPNFQVKQIYTNLITTQFPSCFLCTSVVLPDAVNLCHMCGYAN